MSYLLKIIKPNIGIFLNVTPVHLQNFESLNDIAREKAILINSVQTAIINSDDPLVKKYSHNPYQIALKPINLQIPNYILPPIYKITFGAAFALTKVLGLSTDIATKNLISNFHLPPGRSTILSGLNNSTIIDSSYNSSPLATSAMLKLLESSPTPRLTILGDMRELGLASPEEHLKLYQLALESADTIISVGPETQKYFGSKALKFSYWWQAADYLKKNIPPKSTILIKGSQNTIFLEELVKELLSDKSDSIKLCRQYPHWLKTKEKFRQSIP